MGRWPDERSPRLVVYSCEPSGVRKRSAPHRRPNTVSRAARLAWVAVSQQALLRVLPPRGPGVSRATGRRSLPQRSCAGSSATHVQRRPRRSMPSESPWLHPPLLSLQPCLLSPSSLRALSGPGFVCFYIYHSARLLGAPTRVADPSWRVSFWISSCTLVVVHGTPLRARGSSRRTICRGSSRRAIQFLWWSMDRHLVLVPKR